MTDLSVVSKYTKLSPTAVRLLEKPEKEMRFTLSLRPSSGNFIQADAYVVYWNTARGPAKGGVRFSSDVTLDETRDLAEITNGPPEPEPEGRVAEILGTAANREPATST